MNGNEKYKFQVIVTKAMRPSIDAMIPEEDENILKNQNNSNRSYGLVWKNFDKIAREQVLESKFKQNKVKQFYIQKIDYHERVDVYCKGFESKKSLKYLKFLIMRSEKRKYLKKIIKNMRHIRKIVLGGEDTSEWSEASILECLNIFKRDLTKYITKTQFSFRGDQRSNKTLKAMSMAPKWKRNTVSFIYKGYFTTTYEFSANLWDFAIRHFAKLQKLENLHFEPVFSSTFFKDSHLTKPLASKAKNVKSLSYSIKLDNQQFVEAIGIWLQRVALIGWLKTLRLEISQHVQIDMAVFLEYLSVAISKFQSLENFLLHLILIQETRINSKITTAICSHPNLKGLELKIKNAIVLKDEFIQLAKRFKILKGMETLDVDMSGSKAEICHEFFSAAGNSLAAYEHLKTFRAQINQEYNSAGINHFLDGILSHENLNELYLGFRIESHFNFEEGNSLIRLINSKPNLRILGLNINTAEIIFSMNSIKAGNGTHAEDSFDIEFIKGLFEAIANCEKLETLYLVLGGLSQQRDNTQIISKIFLQCEMLRKAELNFGKFFWTDSEMRGVISALSGNKSKVRELNLRGNFSGISLDIFKDILSFLDEADHITDLDIYPMSYDRILKKQLRDKLEALKERRNLKL